MTINYFGGTHTINLSVLGGNGEIDSLSPYSFDSYGAMSSIKIPKRQNRFKRFLQIFKRKTGLNEETNKPKPLMKSNAYLSSFFPIRTFAVKQDTVEERLQSTMASMRLHTSDYVSPSRIQLSTAATRDSLPWARMRTSNIISQTAITSLVNMSDARETFHNVTEAHSIHSQPPLSEEALILDGDNSLNSASTGYSFNRSEISRVNTRRLTITRRPQWNSLPSPINIDFWHHL